MDRVVIGAVWLNLSVLEKVFPQMRFVHEDFHYLGVLGVNLAVGFTL